MKPNAFVLCSGGPDGVVAAAQLRETGYHVTLLHYQYGQKAWLAERSACQRVSELMRIGMHTVDLAGVFASIESGLLSHKGITQGKDLAGAKAFVPGRNLIFLSIAAGIAESAKVGYIATGNIKDGRYPDNQPAFTTAFDNILPHALSEGVHVRCLAPVNHLTKVEVVRLGHQLHVPLNATWSCYTSGQLHCGVCASCKGRRQAFKDAGLEEHDVEYER